MLQVDQKVLLVYWGTLCRWLWKLVRIGRWLVNFDSAFVSLVHVFIVLIMVLNGHRLELLKLLSEFQNAFICGLNSLDLINLFFRWVKWPPKLI